MFYINSAKISRYCGCQSNKIHRNYSFSQRDLEPSVQEQHLVVFFMPTFYWVSHYAEEIIRNVCMVPNHACPCKSSADVWKIHTVILGRLHNLSLVLFTHSKNLTQQQYKEEGERRNRQQDVFFRLCLHSHWESWWSHFRQRWECHD